MDIEGYEYIVLPEMKDILLKHKPLLQVETWGSRVTVENFLAELGYDIYDLEDGGADAGGGDQKLDTGRSYFYS